MYLALDSILPWQLREERRVSIPDSSEFWGSRSWSYASDRLLPHYKLDGRDVTDACRKRLIQAIKLCILINARNVFSARFLDKSQVFSVKVPFIRALLSDSQPLFVAVSRDPYAMCIRALYSTQIRSMRANYEYKLRTACEHWRNTHEALLEQQERFSDVRFFRMEDFLEGPHEVMKDMCEFAELEYSSELLPAPGDTIPRGSRNVDRWYPLQPDLNVKWYSMLDEYSTEVISSICGNTAERLGYSRPSSVISTRRS